MLTNKDRLLMARYFMLGPKVEPDEAIYQIEQVLLSMDRSLARWQGEGEYQFLTQPTPDEILAKYKCAKNPS